MTFVNIKITDLPPVTSSTEIASTDVLPIVDINEDTTKKVTAEQLAGFVNDNITVGLDQIEHVTGPVFIGREIAGLPTGSVSALSISQAKNMIGNYAGITSGLVPNPPGTNPTSKFLRGDGQWVQPPDSVGLTSITIGASAADVLGVSSNSIITADNPGDNKLIFWDNANSKLTHLSIGDGLEISAGALNATGGGGGGVTSVSTSSPLSSTVGTTPQISFPTWPSNQSGYLKNNGLGVLSWSSTYPGEDAGTFTPTFKGGISDPTAANVLGTYVKIGKMVIVTFQGTLNGGDGFLTIADLPFFSDNTGNEYTGVVVWSRVAIPVVNIISLLPSNSDIIQLYAVPTATLTTGRMTCDFIGTNTTLFGSLSYIAAS